MVYYATCRAIFAHKISTMLLVSTCFLISNASPIVEPKNLVGSINNDERLKENRQNLDDTQTAEVARFEEASRLSRNRVKRSIEDFPVYEDDMSSQGGVAPFSNFRRHFTGGFDDLDIDSNSDKGGVIIPGLTSQPADVSEGKSSPQASPPQFMLDLFQRFENDRSTRPASNIIRSFSNLATPEDRQLFSLHAHSCVDQPGKLCARKHLLLFNVSSIPKHELVKMAELRLYKIVERDRYRQAFIGLDRKVDVTEISCEKLSSKRSPEDLSSPVFCNPEVDDIESRVIESKYIYGRNSGWETFDITTALQRWIQSPRVYQLQINIESITLNDDNSMVDIEPNANSANEPLLIVFSDDKSSHHHLERKDEIRELIRHQPNENEMLARKKRSIETQKPKSTENSRQKRHATDPGPCRVAPMYVNFKDINFDSWIVSPKSYNANKCVGTCAPPYNGENPSSHAIIQGLMNDKFSDEHDKPCCVPSKLGPISMLYYNEDNVLVYKFEYEGMRVLECSCR